jgi:hypothetical protein
MGRLSGNVRADQPKKLALLEPYAKIVSEYIQGRERLISQVAKHLNNQPDWDIAFRNARTKTLRRALELMGFRVETSGRGGVAYVKEGPVRDPENIAPYALVAIDGFSKKASVFPLRSKTTQATADALDAVFADLGIPIEVASDEGGEFEREFAKRLEYYGVRHQFLRTHAVFAERFIRTMKEWLLKRIRAFGGSWIDHLPAVLKRYNEAEHSVTKMSPAKAHDYKYHADVRDEILKHRDPEKHKYPAVSVGDLVRVLQKVPKGARRFDHQDWSKTALRRSNRERGWYDSLHRG